MDPINKKPGLADRDEGVASKILWWILLGGGAMFSLFIMLMFGIMSALEYEKGSEHWWIMTVMGGATVLTLWITLAFSIWLTSKLARRKQSVLLPFQQLLGGEFTKPASRWQLAFRSSLKFNFGEERARLSHHLVKSTAAGSVIASVVDTENAKTQGENYRRFRSIMTMRTNQRAPFKLLFISRTSMAGAFSRLQEVQLSTEASSRIAVFTNSVDSAETVLGDTGFCDIVQSIIDWNQPNITQLHLTQDGALWQTQLTDKVDANEVRRVFEHTGSLIDRMNLRDF